VTIREHFQRFQRRATHFAVIVSVLMAVFINLQYPDSTPLRDLMAALGMGVVLAVVLLLVFKGRFKCPRCGADFRKLRRAQLGRFNRDTRMYWELWDACPRCRVSFDAPFSTSADR
jgi:hypothetical protein